MNLGAPSFYTILLEKPLWLGRFTSLEELLMVGRCRSSCFVFFFWREVFPLGEIGGVQDTGVVSWACFPGDGVWGASGWQPSLLLLPVQPCIPLAWSLLVSPGLSHVPLQSPL